MVAANCDVSRQETIDLIMDTICSCQCIQSQPTTHQTHPQVHVNAEALFLFKLSAKHTHSEKKGQTDLCGP